MEFRVPVSALFLQLDPEQVPSNGDRRVSDAYGTLLGP